MPRVLEATPQAIARAAAALEAGGVVAFPTETVYGLGAHTYCPEALQRVYMLKGRPAGNPLIAHVLDDSQARLLTTAWDERCALLAARFWPGPLSLVLPRAPAVPDQACAGLPTIAVRCPAHPVARRLLDAFAAPISAPSANRSGRVSPTTAAHVLADLHDVQDLDILDGGPCEVGIESTVLDLAATTPRVLRPGSVTIEQLGELLGPVELAESRAQGASPGTARAHYAPRTEALLVAEDDLPAALAAAHGPCAVLAFAGASVPPPHTAITMPRDSAAYANHLYAALRQADACACARILITAPSSTPSWRAIHDRLRRATSSDR